MAELRALVVSFVWIGWFSTAFSRGPGFFVLFGGFGCGALMVEGEQVGNAYAAYSNSDAAYPSSARSSERMASKLADWGDGLLRPPSATSGASFSLIGREHGESIL